MTPTNADVKLAAIENGVKMYQIPPAMGVSASTFERLMRVPLKDKDRQRILQAINDIANKQ